MGKWSKKDTFAWRMYKETVRPSTDTSLFDLPRAPRTLSEHKKRSASGNTHRISTYIQKLIDRLLNVRDFGLEAALHLLNHLLN